MIPSGSSATLPQFGRVRIARYPTGAGFSNSQIGTCGAPYRAYARVSVCRSRGAFPELMVVRGVPADADFTTAMPDSDFSSKLLREERRRKVGLRESRCLPWKVGDLHAFGARATNVFSDTGSPGIAIAFERDSFCMSSHTVEGMFSLFTFGREPGIGRWLAPPLHGVVRERLEALRGNLRSKVQLNQLLVISEAASISDGFFVYYWGSTPDHAYNVKSVEGFDPSW